MTRVLKLVRGSVELDLLNDAGIHLRSGEDNWRPVYPMAVAHGDPEPVVETMRLMCKGTSQDALAGTMQMWADMMQGAAYYRTDANGTEPVWLHAKLNNETGERRSIVHQIDAAWVDSGISDVVDANYVLFDAAVERGPYWERPTPVAMGTMVYTNLIVNGGFETAGGGGADVFGTWAETAGDGSIFQDSTDEHVGSYCARLQSGAAANTSITQTVTVVAEHAHRLVFSSKVDTGDSTAPRYAVYDVTHSAYIVPTTATGSVRSAWDPPIAVGFETPAGCTSIRIDFMSGTTGGDAAYFDQVFLYDATYGPVVVYDYTANGGVDVTGDVPARLGPLSLEQSFISSGGTTLYEQTIVDMHKMWIGVRSAARHPGIANFVPIWECEDGVAGVSTAGASDIAASGYNGASGTAIMLVTPGSADWQSRVTDIDTASGTALMLANYGDYLWLLRAKVASGTYEVKLRWRTSEYQHIEGPTVEITNTSYMWNEMGIAPVPLVPLRSVDSAVYPAPLGLGQRYGVDVWARRTAGTATLSLDCLGLVPIDEGFAVLDDTHWYGDFGANSSGYVLVSQSPLGDWLAVTSIYGQATEMPVLSASGLSLPPGDGRLVIFANGTADSTIAPFLGFQGDALGRSSPSQYYPRWLSLRGAE